MEIHLCTMYKDKSFHIKELSQIEADLSEAARCYGDRVRRIFLADGDALVLSMDKLTDILLLCRSYFPNLERVTSYGTAHDVLRKTAGELRKLHQLGLQMIYMGAESGSDQILSHIRKGVDAETFIKAAAHLKGTGIQNSVTLISGLGGQALLREHAVQSAELITKMKPDYLGFLTLMLEPGAPMLAEVQNGSMLLLTPEQVVEEMELFLTHIDSDGTVFRANHASNYISLSGTLNKDIPFLLKQLSRAQTHASFRAETMRRL